MQLSQHRSSEVADGGGVRFPPIGRSANTVNHASSGVGATGGALSGPRDVRTIQDQCLIYRSVPPTPKNYTLTDMIGAEIIPPSPARTNKVGLSGSSSSEFAKRFMTRPTRTPKVVDFNAGRMGMDKRRRGVNGFYPSMKLRVSAKSQSSTSQKENKEQLEPIQPSGSSLQLVPTTFTEVQPKSAAASRSISRASRQSIPNRKTPDTVRTAPAAPETVIVYPETFECDDLSYLPPPKRILPKRDVPWVFRYKVKRNMNELSKIMASKPQIVDG